MSLKDKLDRMKIHLKQEEPSTLTIQSVEVPFAEKWKDLQSKPHYNEDDYIILREVRYPLTTRHGNYMFAQLDEIVMSWDRSEISHPLSTANRSSKDLFFFDTETTGLHGGVGNTIFLLGYSRIEEDSVVVRQHFLASPHAEITLYQSFLDEVKELKHIVTYNGKAFDWPQVKTRHMLIRDQVSQLPTFEHFDLLHGARRLWKNELESCRLSIIEQAKLGISRKNDVPGYLAPMLYFEYLRNKDPETIQGVLHHNEIDVLSLITLYIHISKLLLDYQKNNVSYEELFEISRWYEVLGADEMAMQGFRKIAESNHGLRVKARIALGHYYKKQKQWKQALEIWEEVIKEDKYLSEEIFIELAKIYEHKVKDYELALFYTVKGFDLWKKKASLLRRISRTEQEIFEKRIIRLENRIDQIF